MSRPLVLSFLLLASSACALEGSAVAEEPALREITLTPEEEVALMEFVNEASFEVLDDDVGLDRRAAQGIVDQRPLADVDALDAVPYVGPVAFDKLYAYLEAAGAFAIEVHGVLEGSDLALDVLLVVNQGSYALLDDTVGLDARAAQNISDARDVAPIDSLVTLDALGYVGPAAFADLVAFVEEGGLDTVDDDGDGWVLRDDCHDGQGAVHPDATEICDGLDNDCDASTTEDGLITVGNRNVTQLAGAGDRTVCPGVYRGLVDFGVNDGTLTGIGDPAQIIIDGDVEASGYGVVDKPDVTLSNLTVRGDVLVSDGVLTLLDVAIEESDYGLTAWTDAEVNADGLVIEGARFAGAWFYRDSSGSLVNTHIEGSGQEGIRLDEARVTVTDSVLMDNAEGGTMVEANLGLESRLTLLRVSFEDNASRDVRVEYGSSLINDYSDLGTASLTCRAYGAYHAHDRATCY
ncbi:MAG: hypothetical protein KTR31_02370 [Myxococcales bacterium]|nr:hypothetical protein [Myxococcales bacterium]